MNKIKKIISFLVIALISANILFSQQTTTKQTKGKIVIVVLDVSGSIKNQFTYITNILDKSIVQDRLEVGDYFVLIPFGDNALPMYSGQLLREEDKASISNTLHAMKADNNWTDIGQAIHEALTEIVSLKQQDFNLYEPLVLFITDGDITTSPSSPYANQKVSQIFEDSLIGNTPLYNGWYYVGIGKDLHDLPEIAKLSGREDYLLRIEDLSKLEFMLDDWISNIPESQPLEQGEIVFTSFKLSSKKLNDKKTTIVVNDANELSFSIVSSYKKTPISLEFISATGLFQSENKKEIIPIKVNTEKGKILIVPLALKETKCSLEPKEEINGKGMLKLNFLVSVNGIEKPFDFSFEIESKSASKILFSKILIPLMILLLIILLVICFVLIKKILPVKITMEIVGKTQNNKSVSVGMKKKVEFGSKPGLAFKLDSALVGNVVGQIQRIGLNKWQIVPRDRNAFEAGNKNIPYELNSPVKIKTRDESYLTIKFKLVKR